MSDLDIEFWFLVYSTWSPEERQGWSEFAERVETGLATVRF